MHTDSTRLLRILHLASPALPIGAFHFSQGLEYAVEAGWVTDEFSSLDWITGIARHGIGTLDLPVLLRLHRACSAGDDDGLRRWGRFLLAARETEELRAEDRHMGSSLARILRDLGAGISTSNQPPGYAEMFAIACAHWHIPAHEALQAYAWTWAENQVLSAVKLVPLGQSAGQRILHSLIPTLEEIATRATDIEDDDIGACAVLQGLSSARHESQYTRLFKS
jgi:urease accessory protein